MKNLITLALVASATLFAQTARTPIVQSVSKAEQAGLRARVEAAVTTNNTTSHFAMVQFQDGNIFATAIQIIPVGSIVALRVRFDDGTSYIKGTQRIDRQIEVGESYSIKSPGGGGWLSRGEQYEVVTLDAHDLSTSVDYIPAFSGEVVIKSGLQVQYSAVNGSAYVFVPLDNSGAFSAVVIGGVVADDASISRAQGGIWVNLNKIGGCFGNQDIQITVVLRDGRSDTTSFRPPQLPCVTQAPPSTVVGAAAVR